MVGLARTLRAAGVDASPERVQAAVQAAAALDPGRRADVYWAGRLTLCGSEEDLARYDTVFAAYFGDRPGSVVRRQRVLKPSLRVVADGGVAAARRATATASTSTAVRPRAASSSCATATSRA